MRGSTRTIHAFLAALGVTLIGAAGCDEAVGIDCAAGFEKCDGVCCPMGDCQNGTCLALDAGMDGTVPDDGGDLDGTVPGDGGDLDGTVPGDGGDLDGTVPGDGGGMDGTVAGDGGADGMVDGGAPICDLGELLCDGVCIDVLRDEDNCGACGVTCTANEDCVAGSCVRTCDDPLTFCPGVGCVDLRDDRQNCGACGNECAADELCFPTRDSADGEPVLGPGFCAEAVSGDVVVLGHDYTQTNDDVSDIAGNSLFIRRTAPTRVVVFEGTASATAIDTFDIVAQAEALEDGQTYNPVVTTAAEVPFRLFRADTFVIHAQPGATDAQLRAWGRDWSRAMDQFLQRGGVIMLLEGPSTNNAGTWQILDAAGLFSAAGRTQVSAGTTIEVVDLADAVAAGGLSMTYPATAQTVRFTDPVPSSTVVTQVQGGTATDDAVIIHFAVGP